MNALLDAMIEKLIWLLAGGTCLHSAVKALSLLEQKHWTKL